MAVLVIVVGPVTTTPNPYFSLSLSLSLSPKLWTCKSGKERGDAKVTRVAEGETSVAVFSFFLSLSLGA